MSQWGNTDDAANSVNWGVVQYQKTPNTTNRTAFFENTTEDAFVTGLVAGQFGVDTTEMGVGAGNVAQIIITSGGTGYNANSVITFTGGGGSSASGNGVVNTTIGKITTVYIGNGGSSYETNPTISFAAPNANSFNANSAVTGGTGGGANSTIVVSTARFFVANDAVTYFTNGGNTAIGGLANNTGYFIQFANTTHVALTSTVGGSRITLTKGFTEAGHFLQGATATGTAVVGGAQNKGVAHAGWVVRTVGTGGRAGRVQYETLVAMGTISNDGSDDAVLPDA